MTVTTVESPLHVAWAQVRSVEHPWAVGLALLGILPTILLLAGTSGALNKLGLFFLLHLLLTALLAGDRRIYRSLGLNRWGALRQHLVLSLPLLVAAGVLTLPGLRDTSWLWVALIALVALAVDAAITLHALGGERHGRRFTPTFTWLGQAKGGGMSRHLLGAPMLRWTVPAGLALGCVLAVVGDPQGSFLWSVVVGLCLLGAVLGPSIEVINGTASLATWQALGLPRRQWSLTVIPIAVLAPLFALLIALAVLGVFALWGTAGWDQLRQLLPAVPGLGLLWAGAGLAGVSLAGGNSVYGGSALGGATPMLFISSLNIIRDPSSGAVVGAVIGVALLALGFYLQHRLIHARNGARATFDTRRYAR